eukprot:scaffold13704_cov102-Isochrysis_galbana.AAC.7
MTAVHTSITAYECPPRASTLLAALPSVWMVKKDIAEPSSLPSKLMTTLDRLSRNSQAPSRARR